MAKKKSAARKASNFSNGSKQKYMDYPQSSTQDSVCQQSSFTQKYQTMKKEAQETGWSFGRSLLKMSPERALKLIRKAGLKCWKDYNGNLFGPKEEAQQAMTVLANNGDNLSLFSLLYLHSEGKIDNLGDII